MTNNFQELRKEIEIKDNQQVTKDNNALGEGCCVDKGISNSLDAISNTPVDISLNIPLGLKKVRELVEDEINNYSFFGLEKIENYDNYRDEEYYRVIIKTIRDGCKTLHLRYDNKEDKISVELGEDTYEEIESFDYTIKYFWMALLEW